MKNYLFFLNIGAKNIVKKKDFIKSCGVFSCFCVTMLLQVALRPCFKKKKFYVVYCMVGARWQDPDTLVWFGLHWDWDTHAPCLVSSWDHMVVELFHCFCLVMFIMNTYCSLGVCFLTMWSCLVLCVVSVEHMACDCFHWPCVLVFRTQKEATL